MRATRSRRNEKLRDFERIKRLFTVSIESSEQLVRRINISHFLFFFSTHSTICLRKAQTKSWSVTKVTESKIAKIFFDSLFFFLWWMNFVSDQGLFFLRFQTATNLQWVMWKVLICVNKKTKKNELKSKTLWKRHDNKLKLDKRHDFSKNQLKLKEQKKLCVKWYRTELKENMDESLNIFRNSNENCDDNNNANGSNVPKVYVFGYGSLLWNPGFEYSKCITGCKSCQNVITIILKLIILVLLSQQISEDMSDDFGREMLRIVAPLIG